MLRRFTSLVIQTRGLKNEVKIKWVRPEYVPAYKSEKSGDLESKPSVPDTTIGKYYALSEEIKDAPEAVKKLFSVAFLGRKEQTTLIQQELMDRVRRHKYDERTAETRIARITGLIRSLQESLDKFPRDVLSKRVAQELIDKRKKLLKILRQYDYRKFEWLLEKLNIEYKAHPQTYHKLSRKESLRKLTELHCEDIKNNKLDKYRNLLESQQGPFLKDKLESLRFIRKEQMELKLPVTVNEQDINKVEKMLEEWTIRDELKRQSSKKKKQVIIE